MWRVTGPGLLIVALCLGSMFYDGCFVASWVWCWRICLLSVFACLTLGFECWLVLCGLWFIAGSVCCAGVCCVFCCRVTIYCWFVVVVC